MEKKRVAVRTLVESVMLSGSLEPGAAAERLVDGIRGHQALQSVAIDGVRNEVPVSCAVRSENIELSVYGRIDRLYPPESPSGMYTVEEIKTTLHSLDGARAAREQHMAQAVSYAHMLAQSEGCCAVRVRVTYLELKSGEIKSFERELAADALQEEFLALASSYLMRLEEALRHTLLLRGEIGDAQFPYPSYRAGQRLLAANAYSAVKNGRALMAEAPTGTGKTMAVLFPAIKALGCGHIERLFCLTARTTQQQAPMDAIRAMGIPSLRSVVISARDKMCVHDAPICREGLCERAQGYYDRLADALAALADEGGLFTRERIAAAADCFHLCPFELSLDLSTIADVVISDYNYAFDPRVKLQRFFNRGRLRQALLVDEAHNLPDRARSMYSAAIALAPVDAVRRSIPKGRRKEPLYGALLKLSKAIGAPFAPDPAPRISPDFSEALELLPLVEAAAGLLSAEDTPAGDTGAARDLAFELTSFLYIAALYDEHYVTLYDGAARERSITLLCADPSAFLTSAYKRCASAVLYSATLTPFAFYRKLLGLTEAAGALALPSPFPRENLGIMHLPLNVRYRFRDRTLGAAAEAARAFVTSRSDANFMVFLPSHAYLARFCEAFAPLLPQEARLFVQGRLMDDAAREAFLLNFSPEPRGLTVGLAVLGGIFSESIDLTAERLSGAVIVGVGLPQVGLERDALRARYDEAYGDGYGYAYLYPGLGRVLQAAGRIIRTPEDRGMLLLIDDRYATSAYRALLPDHWQLARVDSAEDIARTCAGFWD